MENAETIEQTGVSENGRASGGAVEPEVDIDTDRQVLIDAWMQLDGESRAAIQSLAVRWTSLPEVVRDGVLAMVQAVSDRSLRVTGKGS